MKPTTVPSRRPLTPAFSRLSCALFSPVGVAAVAAGALFTFAPKASHAAQFILFDDMYTYTFDDAVNSKPSVSHYYVTEKNWLNKQRPTNWTTPDDYGGGTVHMRVEIIDRPDSGQQAGWAICYVDNAGNYGCPYTDYYTKTGVFEKDASMTTFFQANTIKWATGVKEVDVVYVIDGSGSGHISMHPTEGHKVTPITLRMTIVQVSKGSKYDPSIIPPWGDGGALPAGDGGSSAGDSGSKADTSVTTAMPDAGSSGGTGGAGGTGTEMPPTTTGTGTTTGGTGGAGGSSIVDPPSTTGTAGSADLSGGNGVPPDTSSSCAMSPSRSSGAATGWLALGLFGLAMGARRRRA
jgi:hypothetical protein